MEALIYFAFWAGLIFLMMRFGCGAHVLGHGSRSGHGGDRARPENDDTLRWVPPERDVDPVCGKVVTTERAKPSVHDGHVHYFCSRECREAFESAPELYVGPPGAPQRQIGGSHA